MAQMGFFDLSDRYASLIELKRSTVSVAQGIRQNLDNQKRIFIEPFFTTMQLLMAGNDTEGLRYGVIGTPEKYWLAWKEENPDYRLGVDDRDQKYLPAAPCDEGASPLDCAIARMCRKDRFLEIIHDFMVFDAGVKKTSRHNQYFGVRASQEHIRRREGGIIWHTQGSGCELACKIDPPVLLTSASTSAEERTGDINGKCSEDPALGFAGWSEYSLC